MERPKALTELWYHAILNNEVFNKNGNSIGEENFSELGTQYRNAVQTKNWTQLSQIVKHLTSIYPISEYYHDIWMGKIYDLNGKALCDVNENSKIFAKKYRQIHT